MSRDLVCHGDVWPDFLGSNRARLAVSHFEEGGERRVLEGEPSSERIGDAVSVAPKGLPEPGHAQIVAHCRATERDARTSNDMTFLPPGGFVGAGSLIGYVRDTLDLRKAGAVR